MMEKVKPTKVLIINDFLEKVGGVEIYCYKLMNLLKEEGYNVKLIGGHYEKNKVKKFLASFLNLPFYRTVKKELTNFSPDLVHVQSISANVSPLFLHAIKAHKIPIIMTVHGFSHYICPQFGMLFRMKEPCKFGFSMKCLRFRCHSQMNFFVRCVFWIKMKLHRWMIKKYVDIFITPSELLTDWLQKSLNVKNVFTVPHFIELKNKYLKEPRIRGKNILYVGRVSKEKGIEYLIRAMPLILAKIPNATLHIVGEGGRKNELEQLAEQLGVKNNIIFHGYIPHDRLNKIYSETDVFVLPSVCMESFGLALLEAMSYGIPVITTNIGGQAERACAPGFNGYLVDPKDPQQLAEKAISILDNYELRKILGKNAHIFAQNFNPQSHVKLIKQAYEFALGGKDEKLEGFFEG